MSELQFKRTLLVIGGQRGIGEAITDLAMKEHDDHWGYVMPTAEESIQYRLDVTNTAMVEEFAQNLWWHEHYALDIIYCAGINHLGKIGDLKGDVLMKHYAVNVAGFIMVLNAFHKHWSKERVNVTAIVSDSSRVPMRGSVAYASSKAALAHAIKCSARELAPHWRVNGVSPGVVADTPMTDRIDEVVPQLRGWTKQEALAYERSLIPMGRRATKAEVAEAAIWATRGPQFMTGSIIDITGGK